MKPIKDQKNKVHNKTPKKLARIRYANKIIIGKMVGDVPKRKNQGHKKKRNTTKKEII